MSERGFSVDHEPTEALAPSERPREDGELDGSCCLVVHDV